MTHKLYQLITLLALCLITMHFNGQIHHPQDVFTANNKDLKGDIKSYTVRRYNAKEYFGELKMNSDIQKEKTIQFDSLNRVVYYEEFRDGTLYKQFNVNYSPDYLETSFTGIKKNDRILVKYVLNKKNLALERTSWKNDTLIEKETAKYNNKDSLIEYIRYNQEGKKTEIKTWEYNSMNCLANYTFLTENVYLQEKHKYDNTKKRTTSLEFDINGNLKSTTTFKYDDKNRMIQKLTKHTTETSIDKTSFEYNLNNQLIKETRYYSPDGGEFYIRHIQETQYDASKRKINESRLDYNSDTKDIDDWNSRHIESYFFDEKGRLSETTSRYEYTNPAIHGSKYNNIYAYDTHGNCIKVIQSSSDNVNQPFELMDKRIYEITITYRN